MVRKYIEPAEDHDYQARNPIEISHTVSSSSMFCSISPSGGASRSWKATNLIMPRVVKNSGLSGCYDCFFVKVKMARFNKVEKVLLQNFLTGISAANSSLFSISSWRLPNICDGSQLLKMRLYSSAFCYSLAFMPVQNLISSTKVSSSSRCSRENLSSTSIIFVLVLRRLTKIQRPSGVQYF